MRLIYAQDGLLGQYLLFNEIFLLGDFRLYFKNPITENRTAYSLCNFSSATVVKAL